MHGDDPSILQGPLANTNIWDYGDNGDWINDNRLIIRVNSVIHFFSLGNVYVHVLIFSFIGFLGSLLLYLAFIGQTESFKLFAIAIFLLPSVGLFGSGLTKESILIFSIGLLFWSVQGLLKRYTMRHFVFFLIAVLLCLFNKPYTGLVIIPIIVLLFIGKQLQWKKHLLVLATFGLIISSITLCYLPDKFNLIEKVSYKQKDISNLARGGIFFVTDSSFCAIDFKYFENFDTVANNKIQVNQKTSGEYKLFGDKTFHPFTILPDTTRYDIYLVSEPSRSYFETTPINYQGKNLIKTIPESLVNTLIRPFPNDPGSALKYVTFGQNWLFILFAIWVVFHRKKLNLPEQFWIYILLISSFILLLVIGWTTPVFGAVVRYKIPVDLFLTIALFILFKPKRKNLTS